MGRNPDLWGTLLTRRVPLRSSGGEDVEALSAESYRIRPPAYAGERLGVNDGTREVLCLRTCGGAGESYCPRVYEADSARVQISLLCG